MSIITIEDILKYIFYTPNNTNPQILKEKIEAYGGNEENYKNVWHYIKHNSSSLNPQIIEKKICEETTPAESSSIVGQMKVGSGVVGTEGIIK